MHHVRVSKTVFPLVALFAGGLALGVANADDKPCVSKKFETQQVEAACKSGGQKAAKDLMKTVVKKAKAAGESVKCTTCHKDLKTFEQKSGALEGLKKYL